MKSMLTIFPTLSLFIVLDIWRLNLGIPLIFTSSSFSNSKEKSREKIIHADFMKCAFDANLKHILLDNVFSEKNALPRSLIDVTVKYKLC